MEMIGRLISGRYRMIAPLGEGGMATIWRAVDQQLDREVAVKLLRPQFSADAGFAARFKQEARSIARLAIYFVLALVSAGGFSPASAAETQCSPEDDSAVCQVERDNRMAVNVKARNAYDNARTSGDFSEALALSRQLAAQRDKNGERLLKMVYLQLGWGAHRDYVQAYVWLSEGIAGGADYLVRWRKILAEKMTSDQLAEAKKMAGN